MIDRNSLDNTPRQTAHLVTSSRIDPILRRPDVLRVTGLSQASLYRLMGENQFPKPIKVTDNTVGWKQSEVVDWINDRPRANGVCG